MDCLQLRGPVVLRSTEVLGHADRRVVPDLLALLADGTLTWAPFHDSVLVATATIALAAQSLPPVFPRFAGVGA